ncbi:MAG: hypothetical protein GY832_26375 [Chloroflexi bacterium]|nr:hypothetical protein [Chloroflexota bacterium]
MNALSLAPMPMLKAPPWFGGQMGVPGSDTRLGFRQHPDAVVLYVDSGHGAANDNNDGTNPVAPKATVQSAVNSTFLTPYSRIMVSGQVDEDVVTPDYATGPNYVSIIGNAISRYSPAWAGDDADTPSLDMRAVGWTVQGFRFYGKTGAAAVELRHTDSGANDIAIRSIFDNCYFDGLTTGLAGILTHGCYDVWVQNCTFQLWNNVANTAACMIYGAMPLAIPYRNYIINNVFMDSDNGMVWPSNGSVFYNNRVQKVGYAYTSVNVFVSGGFPGTGGDDNIVYGNSFEGDFSNAGGYYMGPADFPMGNFSDDVAEAEVGAQGLVTAVPT